MGDGETAEGGVWEAAALAAHYKLDNLVAIVDVNRLGQSQATMHGADGEAYARKFGGFGWHTVVIDGHNLERIIEAFGEAQNTKGQPTAIIAVTKKGKGVSFLEDKDGWHGKPLKKGEEVEKALRELPVSGDASTCLDCQTISCGRGQAVEETDGSARVQAWRSGGYARGVWCSPNQTRCCQ